MKNNIPIIVVVGIMLLSAPMVYLLVLFVDFMLKDAIPVEGSKDAWISFAGSIIGGATTMLALYFTIKFEYERMRVEKRKQLRPFVACAPKFEHSFAKTINRAYDSCMYPITIEVENISDNLVKDFRILSEVVLEYNTESKAYDLDNQSLLRNDETPYGIWTVVLDDLVMIKPHNTFYLQTNFVINPYSVTRKKESNHSFQIELKYSYQDSLDLVEYVYALSYELVLNFDNKGGYKLFTQKIRNALLKETILE